MTHEAEGKAPLANQHTGSTEGDPAGKTARQRAMALAAGADPAFLRQLLDALPFPQDHGFVRPPETGLIMARGRMGGTGSPFNLGEVTVTRCALRLASGEMGSAYILGRDKNHAQAAALLDALWQNARYTALIEATVLAPLAEARDQARTQVKAETAATKVDFFTMVRGDN